MHLRVSDNWSISAWLERHVDHDCFFFKSRITMEIVQIVYILMYITDTRSKLVRSLWLWRFLVISGIEIQTFSPNSMWKKTDKNIIRLPETIDESFFLASSNIWVPIYFYWAILHKSVWQTAKRSIPGCILHLDSLCWKTVIW